MTKDLFAIRLSEARLMKKLSMDKLAELVGGVITKQSISRYERGVMRPKHDVLQALARSLDISEDYFFGTGLQIDKPMLRTTSNGKLSDDDLNIIEARLAFWAERYIAKESESGFLAKFENPIAGTAVRTMEDVIHAADLLRERWHCGDGPIASILRLMERKGIKILSSELPDGVDGLSTWADKQHPLVVLDMRKEKTTVERIRFTAAHELAHLLLDVPQESELGAEKRCHKFASFFLLPKRTFIEEIGSEHRDSLTLEELTDIKELYGVSISALVHEAWDLHMISREHYDWWYDERIHKNVKETGWGHYSFPETVGREKRMESIISYKKLRGR